MSMIPDSESRPADRGLRGWPAVIILAGAAAWTWAGWMDDDLQRQYKVMRTGGAVLVGGLLLALWWLFFSRLRWKRRGQGVLAVLALLGIAWGLFRYKGVTGDLVPIFEPRWSFRGASAAPGPKPEVPAMAPQARPSPAGADAGPAAASPAASFPQFLGPARDGVIPGVRLARDWGAKPPERLWRRPVGDGWGGFAVSGGLAVTQEQEGAKELVVAYDLEGGQRVWVHETEARYDNALGGIGPRATPTIVSNRVYAVGAIGDLVCLELGTGRCAWSTNVAGKVALEDLEWGVSSSPLVLGGLVVVAPRGRGDRSLAAYRTETGELAWSGGGGRAHYSSPRLESLLGVPQILTFNSAVAAHDPVTGAVLWTHPWRGGHPHVTDPRVVGTNRVLVSSGYGTGSQLVEVSRGPDGAWLAPTVVWKSMRLKSKFANVVLRDGFAYGLDDGRLACLDLADGSRRWEGERYGHGQVLLVDDLLLLTAESGEVVLVEANPGAFRELARFPAVTGKTWNPPALAGNCLLVRNDREAAAYRLPLLP